MNEVPKPSVFWSVVGVGLPAFVTVIAAVMVVTSEQGAAWIALGVVFGLSTVIALQRVYVAFKPGRDDSASRVPDE